MGTCVPNYVWGTSNSIPRGHRLAGVGWGGVGVQRGGTGVVAGCCRGGAGVSPRRKGWWWWVVRAHVCYGGHTRVTGARVLQGPHVCHGGTRLLRVEERYWIRVTNWTFPVLFGPTWLRSLSRVQRMWVTHESKFAGALQPADTGV